MGSLNSTIFVLLVLILKKENQSTQMKPLTAQDGSNTLEPHSHKIQDQTWLLATDCEILFSKSTAWLANSK